MFSSLKSGSFVPLEVKDLGVVRLALGRVDQLLHGDDVRIPEAKVEV